MNARLLNTPQPWVDPDDAPELTDEFFENGTWRIGEHVVTKEEGQAAMRQQTRGRPVGSVAATTKAAMKLRVDQDVLSAFKATGRGWQTRMNAVLRKAVEQGGV